jgi:hypothetical protein
MMGLRTKKSEEFRVHLSSSASQSAIGAAGASTNAINERPRKQIDCCDRTAFALVTADLEKTSIPTSRLIRLGLAVVNEGLTRNSSRQTKNPAAGCGFRPAAPWRY